MIPLIDAKKTCRICNEEKDLKDFYPNKQCKQGVTGTCRSCSRVRINDWYAENRNIRQSVANETNRRRKREIVENFGDKCLDCGNTYPQYVYQFHHLDPSQKDFNPSHGISKKISEMWKELSKCVMLCANCHMIRHYGKEGVNGSTN